MNTKKKKKNFTQRGCVYKEMLLCSCLTDTHVYTHTNTQAKTQFLTVPLIYIQVGFFVFLWSKVQALAD